MPGTLRKNRHVSFVSSLEEITAAFGRERPRNIQVFGFERATLAMVTASTRNAHASLTLHVTTAQAAAMVKSAGWGEPYVHGRYLPHAAAGYYADSAPPVQEPEAEAATETVTRVHRVRRVRPQAAA